MNTDTSRKRSHWLVLAILFGASAVSALVDWTQHRDIFGRLWTAIARALVGVYFILIGRSVEKNRRLAWRLIWWGMIAGCVAYIVAGIGHFMSFEPIWLKLWTVVVIAAPVALLGCYKIAPFYRARSSFIGEATGDRSPAPGERRTDHG
jgi:uncharacterized membrane protein HdeD (DUF308 family)